MKYCFTCGTIDSRKKKVKSGNRIYYYPRWYPNRDIDNNYICLNCFDRYFRTEHREKETAKRKWLITGKLDITYARKTIYLGWNPRKGICSECKITTGKILMHHDFYIPILPWALTRELCNTCHNKIHNPKPTVDILKKRGRYKIINKQYEHILIMEKYLKRKLQSDEIVHHINRIRSDNSIENLLVMKRSEHDALHALEKRITQL